MAARDGVAYGVIAIVAALCRWGMVGGVGGLRGYHTYDDGVYFAAAMALVHGRLPYSGFVLLHPPGVPVALAPVAGLSWWLPDHVVLVLARVGVLLMGVACTVVIAWLAREWGVRAMWVAGLAYGTSLVAAGADGLTMLEPFGSASLVLGVAVLRRSRRAGASLGGSWLGGALLGLGATVKIWGIVPVVVVLVWWWLESGRAAARRAAASAALAIAVVTGPFLALAGPTMVRMVVLDQLGRGRVPFSWTARLAAVIALPPWFAARRPIVLVPAVLILSALALAAVLAWRARRGRLWVALLAAQAGVLLAAPSFYPHYLAFAAPAAALVLGAGASVVAQRAAPRWGLAGTSALTAGAVAFAVVGSMHAAAFPTAGLTGVLPARGCVTSDSPAVLALVDRLSSDLEQGCPLPVDLSGISYDVGARDARGRAVARVANADWQAAAIAYLTSGDAAVLVRSVGDGFSPATSAELERLVVARPSGNVRVLVAHASAPMG